MSDLGKAFSVLLLVGWVAPGVSAASTSSQQGARSTNVILCMSDDQGWGDAGYAGHAVLRTPHLDRLAAEGVRFERFYAAAPVCSPTRGSCLTGRNAVRFGVDDANVGHLPAEEVTLAEVLARRGYLTGHFGKWHLGTLTTSADDGPRGGPDGVQHYAPPWEHGFQVCFSTEAQVPTWDPSRRPVAGRQGLWRALAEGEPAVPYGASYWTGPGQPVEGELRGDDSRLIVDRALAFVRDAQSEERPFFAVLWFHAPHLPLVTAPGFDELYPLQDQHTTSYYGTLTSMDREIGRLRAGLAELGVERDTLLWFLSDNGPAGNLGAPGSTGGLRGRKGSLYEGGIRVPSLLVWPARIPQARVLDAPCVTSDLFPTLVDALGIALDPDEVRPLDGISLMPLLEGRARERTQPIAFSCRGRAALIDGRHKYLSPFMRGAPELYDLVEDPRETRSLAREQDGRLAAMQATVQAWEESCAASRRGADYGGDPAEDPGGQDR